MTGVQTCALPISSGYALWDMEGNAGTDVTRMLVGSEGTLGLVTKARLKLAPVPDFTGAVLLAFPNLQSAAEAVPRLREADPSTIEIMDAFFLDIVRKGRSDLAEMLPEKGWSMLLVEHEADHKDELRQRLNKTISTTEACRGTAHCTPTTDPGEMAKLWAVRKAGSPLISSIREIGRASGRGRVEISGVAVSLKKKNTA